MTTVTIDLERVLASGKKNTYEGRAFAEIVSSIARSKRVVCLTGAGISTSAGIPDFRSKEGLYKLAGASEPCLSPTKSSKRPTIARSPSSASTSSSRSAASAASASTSASTSSSSSLKGADLFSTQVFSSAESLSKFYRFISNLNTLSASAQPTPTHRFIRTLAIKGKLLRLYTQNIDGLEEKVGLQSANPNDFLASSSSTGIQAASASKSASNKGKSKYQGDLVHLHGRAALVRCTVCTYTGEWTDEISQAYEEGFSMPCAQCQERLSLRKALGKRLNVAVGSLRPAITLYGEQGMEDLFISEISNADIKSRPDCLIIFGTSMKVHGFKQLAKDFAREVEENDGKVVYVNLGDAGKEWNSSIHYHVQGLTDTFVQAVLAEWRNIRPQDFQSQARLSISDFQPTKSKLPNSAIVKEVKKPSSAAKVEDKKRKREEEVVVKPASPTRASRVKNVLQWDQKDRPDRLHSTPAKHVSETGRDVNAKRRAPEGLVTPTSELPSFKKVIRLSLQEEKNRQVSPCVSSRSSSASCDLRTSDEEIEAGMPPSSSLKTRSSAKSATATSPRRQAVCAVPASRRSYRRNDDFIVSDSEQEGADSDFDNIPFIADVDSDDEDTVYVRSSVSSPLTKALPRPTRRSRASVRTRSAS